MSGRSDPSRDLRLGLLALESGVIDRGELVSAVGAWAGSPGLTMAEILIGRGAVDEPTVARLDDRVTGELSLPTNISRSTTGDRSGLPDDSDPTATFHLPGIPIRDGTPGPARDAGDQSDAGSGGPRFRALRPHARGGLGEVYVALDRELNRSVALKELRARLAHDPSAQDRFIQEAEVTGRLEHPGIVPVYSLGRYADGRPYYAMHLIRGETLRIAIERLHRPGHRSHGNLDREPAFRKLLRSVIDACNAVAYAHSRGVVHRDLKPENIMLGQFGETLVVDWGIAKLMFEPADAEGNPSLSDTSPVEASMTRPGSIVGTPGYMSPEQASGDPDRIGPASDVYSLGAILYCILVGRDPFSGGDLSNILDRVRRGIFPSPRRLGRSIDSALEAICLKAMALLPEERYASPLDLANELENWLSEIRYRGEHELALREVKDSLARLSIERAHQCFNRAAQGEGMIWLAHALENAPLDLEHLIRTSLHAWHTGGKALERTLRHGGVIHAVAFCPEGRRLATAGAIEPARLWDVSSGSPLSSGMSHEVAVNAIAFRPDGRLVATGGDDGMIRRWDAVTGEPIGEPIRLDAPVAVVRFNLDGSRIAAVTGEEGPFLWEADTARVVGSTTGELTRVRAVAFSPDGASLALALDDGLVSIRDSVSGRPLGDCLTHSAPVQFLDFDPDGRRLLTGSLDGEARVWDVARRHAIVMLSGPGAIRCLAFRPDGDAFVLARDDGTTRLWESATGRPIGDHIDHRPRVDCLMFRPGGTMLATGGTDGMVRLWCAVRGLPIGPPLAHGGEIRTLAFSPDGGRLATGGQDGTVRCWKVPSPIEGTAERVSCWVRVTTELEFDAGNAIRRMDGTTSWDLRRRLTDLGGAPLRDSGRSRAAADSS
jgi:eukaryotic-like serine/threonine-protein kinase